MGTDWIEFGPPRRTRRPRGRLWALAAVVATVGLLAAVVTHGQTAPEAAAPQLPVATAHAPGSSSPSTWKFPSSTARQSRRSLVDDSLALPQAGHWVLFALGQASVFRIDLATGRVDRTAGTSVDSSGPVSFVAGPHQVLISTADTGSGMVVEDGKPARPLPRLLQQRSQLFAGPPGLLWAQDRDEEAPGSITLVDLNGRPQRPSMSLSGGWPQPDGRGHLLISDVGGVYEAGGARYRRLTSGVVTGVGPHHYLLLECDLHHRCSRVLLDRTTGVRRRLGAAETARLATGTLSPDGRHAALVQWRGAEPPRLRVEDLRHGTARRMVGDLDQQYGPDASSSVAWTPDSRWLVMLLDGDITFLDTRTGRVHRAGTALPRLLQLALRAPDGDR